MAWDNFAIKKQKKNVWIPFIFFLCYFEMVNKILILYTFYTQILLDMIYELLISIFYSYYYYGFTCIFTENLEHLQFLLLCFRFFFAWVLIYVTRTIKSLTSKLILERLCSLAYFVM